MEIKINMTNLEAIIEWAVKWNERFKDDPDMQRDLSNIQDIVNAFIFHKTN